MHKDHERKESNTAMACTHTHTHTLRWTVNRWGWMLTKKGIWQLFCGCNHHIQMQPTKAKQETKETKENRLSASVNATRKIVRAVSNKLNKNKNRKEMKCRSFFVRCVAGRLQLHLAEPKSKWPSPKCHMPRARQPDQTGQCISIARSQSQAATKSQKAKMPADGDRLVASINQKPNICIYVQHTYGYW